VRTSPLLVLLASIAGLFAAVPADARCTPGYVTAFPDLGGTLPANGRIVFVGNGIDAAVAETMATRAPTLVGGDDRVPLTVAEVDKGDFRFAEALLVPSRALKVGRKYALHWTVDRKARSSSSRGPGDMTWTVRAADTTAPTWDAAPTFASARRTMLGCGPAVRADVTVPVTDDGGAPFFRVRVTDGTRAVTFFSYADEGALSIGHEMCAGPVDLVAGTQYVATLQAVDAAGNTTDAPSTVSFVAP
jgi:hypothetical protein